MKRNKNQLPVSGFVPIVIILILTALLAITGGVVVWQSQQVPIIPETTPSPVPTLEGEVFPTTQPQPTSTTVPTPTSDKTDDYYSWSVEDVCVPLCIPDVWCPNNNIVKDLGDGTLIYRRNGELFRGIQNQCKCLPADTLISTPNGEVAISRLQKGDLVWTASEDGKRTIVPILKTSKVKAPPRHHVIRLTLADGREVTASPMHPLADGRLFAEVSAGDIVDGVKVMNLQEVAYNQNYTYDLLPAGETGLYWASGVLLKSTLAK